MNPIPRIVRNAGCLAITAFLGLPAAYAIDTAGVLEVNLDASTYVNGSAWQNTGALVGDFAPGGTPRRESVWGHDAVLFDGFGDVFRGPVVNNFLVGNTARTIEVWAWQNGARPEETMVAWSRRGGGDGTNESFNWGADREWGAHGAWGQPGDLGWNPAGNNNNPGGGTNDLTNMPTLGQWHHLVYTYDPADAGGTMRVYDNGVLKNSQGGVFLNSHAGFNMVIGAQNNDGNGGAPPGFTTQDNVHFSGAIAKVRVHSGVLSPTSVNNNYIEEAPAFSTAPTPAQLTLGPAHRYTFDNLASGADGTVVPDVIGGRNATIRGAGAAPQGTTGINLPGGSPASAAYVDLPNQLLSSRTNITLETWMTVESTQNWSRIMDFGTTDLGELTGPDARGYGGTNYVMLSASNDTSANQRFEHVGGQSENAGFGLISRDTMLSSIVGSQQHVVFTYDDVMNEWRYYRDGKLVEVIPDVTTLGSIPDVNNWLGRSQWSGDNNTDGIYNEFRVYDYALSPNQVLGNFTAGPDVINVPEPGSVALITAAAAALGLRRRRKSG